MLASYIFATTYMLTTASCIFATARGTKGPNSKPGNSFPVSEQLRRSRENRPSPKRVSINRCAPRYAAKRRRLLGVNGSTSAERDPKIRSPRVGRVFSAAVSRARRRLSTVPQEGGKPASYSPPYQGGARGGCSNSLRTFRGVHCLASSQNPLDQGV